MNAALLEVTGIVKRFPGVVALQGVDFSLQAGEVHVLLGENGAGKSTLIKMLSGAYEPDAGEIRFDGRPVAIRSPKDAQQLGIRVVYQEFNLVPTLSVAENIHLGHLPRKGRLPLLDRSTMLREAERLLGLLGARIDCSLPVSALSVAERQMVEIARALAGQARVLILDEPTAALTIQESERLVQTVAQLKMQGVGIIYISHRMEEIRQVGDRITILRDGRRVTTVGVHDATIDQLVELMTGRSVQELFPRRSPVPGRPLLECDRITTEGVSETTFTLRAGEVVGITGPVGSGALDLARVLFGIKPLKSGGIKLRGAPARIRSIREAIAAGIAFLPEDRKELGLVLQSSIWRNTVLSTFGQFMRRGLLDVVRSRAAVSELIGRLNVVPPDMSTPVHTMSGGNQQKVVIGKWLLRRPDLYIFAEPTRGVDVGAKEEVYQLINQLTAEGAGVLLVSSDLQEVIGMSDRILVMHRGDVVAELTGAERTQERVLTLAFSGGRGEEREVLA